MRLGIYLPELSAPEMEKLRRLLQAELPPDVGWAAAASPDLTPSWLRHAPPELLFCSAGQDGPPGRPVYYCGSPAAALALLLRHCDVLLLQNAMALQADAQFSRVPSLLLEDCPAADAAQIEAWLQQSPGLVSRKRPFSNRILPTASRPLEIDIEPGRLAIGMVTSPRAERTVEATLQSLRFGGFEEEIHLFAEPNSLPPNWARNKVRVHQNQYLRGCWKNYLNMADELLAETTADYLLLCEDDIECCAAAAAALHYGIQRAASAGCYSLYTPIHNLSALPRPSAGWLQLPLDNLWGSLALCFPRDVLRQMCEEIERHHEKDTDVLIARFLAARGHAYWAHVPSLVRHRLAPSTLGHAHWPGSEAVQFDPDYANYIAMPLLETSTPSAPGSAQASSNPLISIVLPVYNGANYLQQAIGGVLAQTYQRWELIIVDDGSTDDSTQVIERQTDPRIRAVRHAENFKLPAALNTGFHLAQGEYLTWISADNICFPTMLQQLLDACQSSGIPIACADLQCMDAEGRESGVMTTDTDPAILLRYNTIRLCFLYHTAVRDCLGDYDEDAYLAEDYQWWLRAARTFQFTRIARPLMYYRQHPGQLTETRHPAAEQATHAARRQAAARQHIQAPRRKFQPLRLAHERQSLAGDHEAADMPLRVGFLTLSLTNGGVEQWLLSLLKYVRHPQLAWRGVCLVQDKRIDAAMAQEVRQYTSLWHGPVTPPNPQGDHVFHSDQEAVEEFLKQLDVVVLNNICDWSGSLSLDRFPGRLVVVSHGMSEFVCECDDFAAAIGAKRVAVSEGVRDHLSPSGSAVTVIRMGIDPARCETRDSRESCRREFGLSPEMKAIAYLGRITPEKNPAAVAATVRHLPENFKAFYMGDCPANCQYLLDQIVRYAKHRLIHWPSQPNLSRALQSVDCCVFASPAEGNSLALLEAAYAGVPIVTTRTGAVPELEAQFGSLFVTVDFNPSPAALASAVQTAVSPDNLPRIKRAQEVVRQHFLAPEMAAQWLTFFQSLAPRQQSSEPAGNAMPPADLPRLIAPKPAEIAQQSNDDQKIEQRLPVPGKNRRTLRKTMFLCPALVNGGSERWMRTLIKFCRPDYLRWEGVAVTEGPVHPLMLRLFAPCAPVFHAWPEHREDRYAAIRERLKGADRVIVWGVPEIPELLTDFQGEVIVVAHGMTEWTQRVVRAGRQIGARFVATGDQVRAACFQSTDDVVTIVNGIDPDNCRAVLPRETVRESLGFSPTDRVIANISRVATDKRAEALALAISQLPESFKALYVGDTQWWAGCREIEQQIVALAGDRYYRLPSQPSTGNIWSAADCYMNCGMCEGFQLTILEAAYREVPQVVTPIGCVPELEARFGSLFVTVPFDASATQLAAAVQEALSAEHREKLPRARQIVEAHYLAPRMAADWEKYLGGR